MATNTKFVQMRNPLLKVSINASATEAIFTEFVDLNGDLVTQTDFGTVGYGTLEPNTDREEAISFVVDSNVDGEATLTITRGLLGKHPYGAGGPTYTHQAQSELVISNNPDLFNKLTAKDNDEVVTGSWQFPTTPVHAQNPVTKSHLESAAVLKTGNETVAGIKTFSSSPVVPDAVNANQPLTKGQSDTIETSNVKLTGDQTVAGVKTFSSSPIIPDATTAQQPISKAQFDAAGASFSATASTTVRGTTKIDVAADDIADPKALTATANRVAALAGGGAFGTPSASNQFVTEEGFTSLLTTPQVVTFTSSGTWTKDAGLKYIVIEGVGGGCGGEGDAGRGGSGGGYFKKLILASALSAKEAVTIGAGTNGTSGAAPTTAGNTSFGSICTGNGGTATTGGTASGGDINVTGGVGSDAGSGTGANYSIGGSSYMGIGGGTSGQNGTGYGAGGAGGGTSNNGGNGTSGFVIVTEYYT